MIRYMTKWAWVSIGITEHISLTSLLKNKLCIFLEASTEARQMIKSLWHAEAKRPAFWPAAPLGRGGTCLLLLFSVRGGGAYVWAHPWGWGSPGGRAHTDRPPPPCSASCCRGSRSGGGGGSCLSPPPGPRTSWRLSLCCHAQSWDTGVTLYFHFSMTLVSRYVIPHICMSHVN